MIIIQEHSYMHFNQSSYQVGSTAKMNGCGHGTVFSKRNSREHCNFSLRGSVMTNNIPRFVPELTLVQWLSNLLDQNPLF